MASNSNKGAAMLASILQKRMKEVSKREIGVTIETGEIMAGKKLKLSSLPNEILDKDDYSICTSTKISKGDQVLVVWTFDGEPVVIDKILRADKA